MRTTSSVKQRRHQGNALMVVLVLGAVSILVLLGTLNWAHSNTRFCARNNQYFRSLGAAEAATEEIVARVGNDYLKSGIPLIQANLASYTVTVPTPAENSYWANYQFANENGISNRTSVEWLPQNSSPNLSTRYTGLRGFSRDIRITSQARELTGNFDIVARNQQVLQLAVIPVFQYAIFYNLDLEINPGPPMNITGAVHCNSSIYTQPGNTLTFQTDVTAAGQIVQGKKPGDPLSRSGGTVIFDRKHTSGAMSLNLPIGAANSPTAVHQILEVPPWTESPTSLVGAQRLYNQADMVVLVQDSGTTVTSGLVNNFGTTIPAAQASLFVNPVATFYNARENKNIQCTEIDVAKLRQWNQTNTLLRPVLPLNDVSTIYVADLRTQTGGNESGVRLINGETLLPKGLTVATPNPAYIKGNYNVSTNGTPVNLGTTNTSQTVPASVLADAIGILSANWTDANSSKDLSNRKATDTTVNAALLSGIVQTVSGSYSGGVENYPRFLEDWSGRVFTYNGSMVVMYESQTATAPWSGNGSSVAIYGAPNRNWAFDQNFNDMTKLPPSSPQVRLLIRGTWSD